MTDAPRVRRVIVTRHALERARHRYRAPDLSPSDVRADVEDAVAAGREGVRPPSEIPKAVTRRSRLEGARYAWTADLRRCYLLKRVRDERQGYERVLIVITSVQGAPPAKRTAAA